MIQEDKQLLLKDLCARLPYGVIIHNEEGHEGHLNSINQTIFGIELGVNITATRRADFQLDTCKPYLRPMSSMTEEEIKEYNTAIDKDTIEIGKTFETPSACMVGINALDWLNKHHFDYRGLIEKGLALKAPEVMYKF